MLKQEKLPKNSPSSHIFSNESFGVGRKGLLENLAGLDPRPIAAGLLHPRFVAFDMEAKKLVNPDDLNSVWIQGAAGGGLARILLSTNATRLYFIEQQKIDTNRLATLVDPLQKIKQLKYGIEYPQHKHDFGFSLMAGSSRILAEDFYQELQALGVPLISAEGTNNVNITKEPKTGFINIDFKWDYQGQKPKLRQVTYIEADLMEPESYLPLIAAKEKKGINGYYQLASYELLNVASRYLPDISTLIAPGGFVLIDPRKNFGRRRQYRFSQSLRGSGKKIVDPFLNKNYVTMKLLFEKKLLAYGQAVRPYQIF